MEVILNGVIAGLLDLFIFSIGVIIVFYSKGIGRDTIKEKHKPVWRSVIDGLIVCTFIALAATYFVHDHRPSNTGGIFGVYDYYGEPAFPADVFWDEELQDYVLPNPTIEEKAKSFTLIFTITFIPFIFGISEEKKKQ